MARSSVAAVIAKFKKILDTEGIAYVDMILFGSHAKGLARDHSDVDICVVLKVKDDALKPMQSQLNFLAGRNQLLMDVIVTNPKQLRSNKVSPILHEIRTHGKVI